MFALTDCHTNGLAKHNRYACSYGHPSWPLFGRFYDAVAREDLLWRILQNSQDMLGKTLMQYFPAIRKHGDEFILDNGYGMSLRPESCGAYRSADCRGLLYTLKGRRTDSDIITKAIKRPESQGYYPGPLIQLQYGFLPSTMAHNIFRSCNISLSQKKRYLFDKKPCHYRIKYHPMNVKMP